MEIIINKYKDEKDYVSNLEDLYNELCFYISKSEASDIIETIYFKNLEILNELKKENRDFQNIKKLKDKRGELLNYICKEKSNYKENIKIKVIEKIDISFYIDYILNSSDNSYLSLLPSSNDKESLLIVDNILTYFIKEINTIKYLLSIDEDLTYIEILNKNILIYNELINFKNEIINSNNSDKIVENEILYYMNGDTSYIYNDIIDSPEVFNSINTLIDSIKSGLFKKIKYFSNNKKTRGLLEVRDLSNKTRVLFEVVGYKKYCIIGAILNKKETNSLYKDKLITRYTKYKLEKDNCSKVDKRLTKVLKGDTYE